ncbi:hypothetical protein [Archaeoglobus veneficus]|uniref:Uncharacterized protein n=1 Tax=Archaeoglobus veneficus (strain DSM 11195 / SNP6) TaxID=693661 RepID=F2KTC5_ARCVS|nr:hypothetical protein [Archaeoglobus veneficus]AEA47155.1 hypothetical protein Arcve_1147 [Archaeoglobus veneficus SNP6]
MDTGSIAAIYALLLTYTLLGGRLKVLRPFPLAVALYLIADTIIFNLSQYYPVVIPTHYLLLLLISVAIITADLPKKHFTTSAGFALAAFSAYMILKPFNSEIALFTLALLAFLSISYLASGFEGSIAKGVAAARIYALFAFAAMALINFAKPYLKGGLADFAEWLVVAALALAVVKNVKLDVDTAKLEEHRQRVLAKSDELADSIDSAAKNFIELGDKAGLIAYVSKALFDAGYSEERVADVIALIAAHEDEKVPKFSFGWERKLIESRNRKRREKILNEVMFRLKELK